MQTVITMRNKYFKKFISLNDEQKLVLLKSLDYDVDNNGYIVDKNNKKVLCQYSNHPVLFKNASILPGSTVIVNTSLITISEYISEYLEPDEDVLNIRTT